MINYKTSQAIKNGEKPRMDRYSMYSRVSCSTLLLYTHLPRPMSSIFVAQLKQFQNPIIPMHKSGVDLIQVCEDFRSRKYIIFVDPQAEVRQSCLPINGTGSERSFLCLSCTE